MVHHHGCVIACVPGRFTQRGYLLPISGWHRAHPLRSKKHPSGSSHANPLLTTMRWFTIMVTSTSPHTRIMRVKRKSSTCDAVSQHEPNQQCPNETHVRQMVRPSIVDSRRRPSPRMHSLFVRWFGRPVGLTPTSTHRFLACIQRQAQLVLLHRSASQTNGLTASDCPNETRVHHVLFQCQ